MRALLLSLVVLAPAVGAQTPEPQVLRPHVFALTSGASDNGPSVRLLRGTMRCVSDGVTVGLVNRAAVSVGRDREFESLFSSSSEQSVPSTYLEAGPSVRAAVGVGDRAELALSAGVAVASRFLLVTPFDAGFTAPLEAEAAVRVWRRVGVAASASVSLPLVSVWANGDVATEDYSLSNRALTVGLRLGM